MPSALAHEPVGCAGMTTDLMLLILEVNDLTRRLARGDLTVADELAEKARLLETIADEVRDLVAGQRSFDDVHEPADHRPLREAGGLHHRYERPAA